jgi:Flp pilus assembly pilin Flp
MEVCMTLFARLRAFVRDPSGQSLAEYGMLVTLIALVTLFAVTDYGATIGRMWADITTSLATIA